MNLDDLFSQDAFMRLEPDKRATFRKFAAQIEGKSGAELMGLFLQFSKELSKGKPMTNDEKSAVIAAIGNSLPPADQPKFKNILKMINLVDN